MYWLFITIGAYLLFALANVGDKLMITKYKTEPIVYAFYVGFLGIGSLVLIPFGVVNPGLMQLFWSLVGGFSFVFALYAMYKAISHGETSTAITILGGTAPIFTFVMAFLFLHERLSWNQLIAFGFLVTAIIVISWQTKKDPEDISKPLIKWAIIAGFVFAISFVSAKYIYSVQDFISGFFWIRIGGFITAIVIYLSAHHRKLIIKDFKRPKKTNKAKLLFIIQVLGGAGVVGQNYAFSLASATLINALQAVQYAFIFVLVRFLGKSHPEIKEKFSHKIVVRKTIAIVLIAIGLYFLAIK